MYGRTNEGMVLVVRMVKMMVLMIVMMMLMVMVMVMGKLDRAWVVGRERAQTDNA